MHDEWQLQDGKSGPPSTGLILETQTVIWRDIIEIEGEVDMLPSWMGQVGRDEQAAVVFVSRIDLS